MNANEFSDALGEIGGKYVADAVTYRRRGRWIPWIAAAACLLLIANLFFPASLPVTQTPTGGTQAYHAEGVSLSLPRMGESSVVVESVGISMNIQTLSYFNTGCIGTAVVEMTLRNPTDETVTIPMTLLCGQAPRYLYTYDENDNSICVYPDASLYRFTLNGAFVETTHLVTATDLAPDEERMNATSLIRLDSPVTRYTYRITELEQSGNPRLTLWGFNQDSDYIVLLENGMFYDPLHSSGDISVPISEGDLPEAGETITVYVIGEHPEFKPGWYFKDWDTKERLDSATVLESTETMTFQDFANLTWKESLELSKENWAFSVAAELNHFPLLSHQSHELSAISIWCHHWLTYELTLAPGETAAHQIEIPLYPHYLSGGSISTRTYEIDLRSLRFLSPTVIHSLTLTTPFEMTETSVTWAQTDDRYEVELAGLDDMELRFTLAGKVTVDSTDPDVISIAPQPRTWLTRLCLAILAGLFLLYLKYRRERFVSP